MSMIVHRLMLPLVFPEGISAGEGREGNRITIARDGHKEPRFVLRGTSLAGALRHAYARHKKVTSDDLGDLFGNAPIRDPSRFEVDGQASRVKIQDCIIDTGGRPSSIRTHNAINRHTGTTIQGALVTVEALPPGSSTKAVVWIHADKEDSEAVEGFVKSLVALAGHGLTLGGRSARGVGRALLQGDALVAKFDLTTLEGLAGYDDCVYDDRVAMSTDPKRMRAVGERVDTADAVANRLHVSIELGIPRGEDTMVGQGDWDFTHEMEPQQVVDASGAAKWRIPGSSLRGVFRAWVTRLAAREGHTVADHVGGKDWKALSTITGDDLAWGFDAPGLRTERQNRLKKKPESLDSEIGCPVMRLFGSSYSKGRIQISDGLAPVAKTSTGAYPAEAQVRSHVAVDRFTGGANEGFFFTNLVLTSASAPFNASIIIENPTEEEARWVAETLRALDLGILSVGSSKAGGRLALKKSPSASGPFANLFTSVTPSEN